MTCPDCVDQAMLTVPVQQDPGLVETILRPGYEYHGERMLRAAQVGVGVIPDAGEK